MPSSKTKIIYGKILTCGELRHLLDPYRDADGFARRFLIRKCIILECPGPTLDVVLAYLKVSGGRMTKNHFTSKTISQYKENPDPGVDFNWYSR